MPEPSADGLHSESGSPRVARLPTATVRFIVFNASFAQVAGGEPLTPGVDAGTERYLDYLAVALESYRQRHRGAPHAVEVWLAELAPGGLEPGSLRRALAERGVTQRFSVSVIGRSRLARFLTVDSRRIAAPSPNRLHEHLLFFAIQHCATRWLALLDPDVICTEDGVIERVFARLEAAPAAWAASFVDPSRTRHSRGTPWPTRPRMHSVALFLDPVALREHLPIRRFLEREPDAQLDGHPDSTIAAEYRQLGARDSLSYLTEWLRHGFDVDHLLDLAEVLGPVREGPNLTLHSRGLLHWKFLDPGGPTALARTLGEDGGHTLDDPFVARCLARGRLPAAIR